METNKMIQACLQGDERAQQHFYDQYKVKMYGLCLRFAASQTEAEDMLMEGFYKVFRDLGQFRGQCPLEAWVRRVMVNAALMHLRKKHRQLTMAIALEEVPDDLMAQNDLLDSLDAHAVISLIQQLPPGFRAVFNLFAIEGYSHREISEQLGVSESTSRSQYTRAKKAMQKLVIEQGIVNAKL